MIGRQKLKNNSFEGSYGTWKFLPHTSLERTYKVDIYGKYNVFTIEKQFLVYCTCLFSCIWTRFRVTGPKSRGPGPITRARSHKNDFYGTGPIKMLNSRDRSHISKIGHISRLWEGWNWLILCDSDYLLCQFGFIKAKKANPKKNHTFMSMSP